MQALLLKAQGLQQVLSDYERCGTPHYILPDRKVKIDRQMSVFKDFLVNFIRNCEVVIRVP